jgi:ComF family protein
MGKAEALRLAVVAATALRRASVTATEALVAATLAPSCVACARALDEPFAGPVCHGCWEDARRAAGGYDGSLPRIIHAFKYDGRRSLAQPLGTMLRERGRRVLQDADCVIPVPLFAWRRLRRGFNQAAELARHLERPVVHGLWRVRPTPPQAGLTAAARRRNVRGAFRLSPLLSGQARHAFIDGHIVVLIDDVMTTGATLRACADVLHAAGAREVRVLTLARAPLHQRGHGLPDVGGDDRTVPLRIEADPPG